MDEMWWWIIFNDKMDDMHRRVFIVFLFMMIGGVVLGQSIEERLGKAFQRFKDDSQMKHALVSLFVVDGKSGKAVFDYNSGIGMAPASTQKIFTSTAAYELLGRDFRYKTEIGYKGTVQNGALNGAIIIKGSGDPTFGSWRWKQTSEDSVLMRIQSAVTSVGIRSFSDLVIDNSGWEGENIPGGWVWEDIGNYYGAGASVLNWRENQYDLILKSGNHLGEKVTIAGTKPELFNYPLDSYVTAAEKGTGDNTIIYLPAEGENAVVRGTIPVGEDHFAVSGAIPSGSKQFLYSMKKILALNGITQQVKTGIAGVDNLREKFITIHTEQSPTVDSIIYWFLRKSINLYGEALAKTIAHEKGMPATTENGVDIIKKFWNDKGIELTELNLHDGSGLSPLNRVTTHAQVQVLQYALNQPWYDGFYKALPEYNGMKMKSGTISAVKGFCGYQRAADGRLYIFSFLVNNYNGGASSVVKKMYEVLGELKN